MPGIDITSDIIDGTLDAGGAAAPVIQPEVIAPETPPGAVQKGADIPAKPDTGITLRDQLSKAFRPEDDDAPKPDANGILRTKDGKYASKVEEDKDAARIAAAAPPAVDTAKPIPPVVAAMSPQDRETFAKLPAEMQQYVARTIEQANSVSERASSLGDLVPVIDQYREGWALNGIMPAQAVSTLLAMNDFCTRDPAAFIRHIAQSHQIDLDTINDGIEPLDPQVAELKTQVRTLTDQLGHFTTGQQQAQHNAVLSTVDTFAMEKGADNNPLRPHFYELADDINAIIPRIRAANPNLSHTDTLQAAYDRAVWANPATRDKAMAAQRASEEAARLAQQRADAGRAHAASVSVTGVAPDAGGGSAAASGNRTLREELAANFASATAAV